MDKKKQNENIIQKEGTKISIIDLVMLEKAYLLNFQSSFERKFLETMIQWFRDFGLHMKLTDEQRNIIKGLAIRFDQAHLRTLRSK